MKDLICDYCGNSRKEWLEENDPDITKPWIRVKKMPPAIAPKKVDICPECRKDSLVKD